MHHIVGVLFEFDAVNRILLVHLKGPLTESLLKEVQPQIRKYSTENDARAGIFDFSCVTEVPLSTDFIRRLALQKPSMANAASSPRMIVAPNTAAFGLSRMFQIIGEQTRPLLHVVRTMEEALAILGVNSPLFEALA